ncbi:MAG: hypothetical protein VX467_06760 [Verrucomicrobiota bacterium]|nr:hypothetical protein [Verrucomicrobiota bacterium]
MKNHSYISFTLLSLFLLLCSSCFNDSNIVDIKGEKASLPHGLIVESGLGEALSVIEVRTYNSTDKELVVEGFIGGRKRPFTKNSAIFILGDHSLETCDEKDNDNCPTPWDVCCEDRNKIANSTMSVQLLDANGSILAGTLEGVAGLEAGTKVKVRGSLDEKTSTRAFIINAKNIQLIAD